MCESCQNWLHQLVQYVHFVQSLCRVWQSIYRLQRLVTHRRPLGSFLVGSAPGFFLLCSRKHFFCSRKHFFCSRKHLFCSRKHFFPSILKHGGKRTEMPFSRGLSSWLVCRSICCFLFVVRFHCVGREWKKANGFTSIWLCSFSSFIYLSVSATGTRTHHMLLFGFRAFLSLLNGFWLNI